MHPFAVFLLINAYANTHQSQLVIKQEEKQIYKVKRWRSLQAHHGQTTKLLGKGEG
jgi:hypothetical protein